MSRTAGLTLHWFGGVATHDPTNNFKLYSRRLLDATPIESQAGFELALELTVKATLAGRRVAEVPTTWRDRTAGESNFKLRKWLPFYLHWYWVGDARPVGAASGAASMLQQPLRRILGPVAVPRRAPRPRRAGRTPARCASVERRPVRREDLARARIG